MEEEGKKLIANQMKKLPVALQQAISASNLQDTVQSIGTKNHLHIDQIGKLEDEVILTMMGFENLDDFTDRLIKNVNLSREVAAAVSNDVASEIFSSIREAMKEFMEKEVKKENPPTNRSPVTAVPSQPATPSPFAPPSKPLPVPAKPAEIHPADLILTQKTVSMPTINPSSSLAAPPAQEKPQAGPPKPSQYKIDPYREPPEV